NTWIFFIIRNLFTSIWMVSFYNNVTSWTIQVRVRIELFIYFTPVMNRTIRVIKYLENIIRVSNALTKPWITILHFIANCGMSLEKRTQRYWFSIHTQI